MALETEGSRSFVLSSLKGKGKKRSTTAPAKSLAGKTPTKVVAKKRRLQAEKNTRSAVPEETESTSDVKRLRQDALQWKLLSAQPEDFGDNFEGEISTAMDTDDNHQKSSRTRKSDSMANLFDNEGGMMMLEEVEGVDVMWEEDGKGGKKATLIEAKPKKTKQIASKAEPSQKQKVDQVISDVKPNKAKNNKRKRSDIENDSTNVESVGIDVDVAKNQEGDEDLSNEVESATGDHAAAAVNEDAEEDDDVAPDAKSISTFERAKDVTFNDALLPEWKKIPLHPLLKKGLHKLGFSKPTDIQRQTIPVAINGLPVSTKEETEDDETDAEEEKAQRKTRDIVGVAETGSGKTLAYSLPILNWLLSTDPAATGEQERFARRAKARRVLSALVLCPTRELALQVHKHMEQIIAGGQEEPVEVANTADEAIPKAKGKGKGSSGKKTGQQPKQPPLVSIASIVGGLSVQKQKRLLARGCDILVATPGRLWDLCKEDSDLATDIKRIKFLVIDEADRMIETGHFAELEEIVALTERKKGPMQGTNADEADPTFKRATREIDLTDARDDMQTFVFSATLSKDLQTNLKRGNWRGRKAKGGKSSTLDDLLQRLDFRDSKPALIDISPEGGLVATLRESIIECLNTDKANILEQILHARTESDFFVGSIDGIRRITPLFEMLKVPVYPLHSQLQQKQRLKNLDRFASSSNGVLIATDVAARGLDIPSVDHVIHFQLPRTADAYIHRSGRTARARQDGFSLQMVSPEERGMQKALMKSLGRTNELPELQVEPGFLPKLRERVRIAREIEKAQHAVKKAKHEKSWLQEAAEAMDIDLDPDLLSAEESDDEIARSRKKPKQRLRDNAPRLRHELDALLAQPLMARGVSAKYPTSGSRVVINDLLSDKNHPQMLGASTAKAHEVVDARPTSKKVRKFISKKGRK
ncbi:hypothetical protein QFC19_001971 [Naganishia cerealis]|uniref:Uncharacterized protein n=1 Tax=Naganishia cerealis TaxID=610337 RepID=A0ACC2WF96_9TREE|nr:hypothetical protein QFC19_001971 [Naganishia cerealis]